MTAHARFSPSAASRWMACPGSIALSAGVESQGSVYADEGSAAHELAQRALSYRKPASFWIGEEIQIGHRIFVVDAEMAEYVQAYCDDVLARVGDGTLLVEQRVGFSQAIGVEGQFGTADAIILSANGHDVAIVDLKYGQGVRVDAEENPQLMTYAAAVLETFDTIMDGVQSVTMVVSQPRLDHVSEWECPIGRIREHVESMRLAAQAALAACDDMELDGHVSERFLHPSDKACQWCPVKATCPKLRATVSALVYDDFAALEAPEAIMVMGDPPVPKQARLGALYGVLDLIEGWCRSVRGEVERQVMAGITIIGPDGEPMKVIEGRKGHRTWIDPKAAEALLAGFLPADKLYKPVEIITPAVADKLLKKQKHVIADLVKQSDGRPKVTLGSDPAPPYSGAASADEFGSVEGEE